MLLWFSGSKQLVAVLVWAYKEGDVLDQATEQIHLFLIRHRAYSRYVVCLHQMMSGSYIQTSSHQLLIRTAARNCYVAIKIILMMKGSLFFTTSLDKNLSF